MCFSAAASFSGAVVLSIIGALTIKKVTHRSQLFLAVIPFLFAFQQLVEGLLWISSSDPEQFQQFALLEKYLYLSIAFFWPLWIPLSLYSLERIAWRGDLLAILFAMGVFYATWMAVSMFYLWPSSAITVHILDHGIEYAIPPQYSVIDALYLLTTLLPFFISSFPRIWIVGLANLVGFAIALYFFESSFISVWCFFAAWVSTSIYLLLRSNSVLRRS